MAISSSDSDDEEEFIAEKDKLDLASYTRLDASNLLLRGSVLRSAGWVLGVAVYTGRQTKVAMNSSNPPSKLSNIERTINSALIVVVVTQVVLVIASDLLRLEWVSRNIDGPVDSWYLYDANSVNSLNNGTTDDSTGQASQSTDITDGVLPDYVAYFFTFFILYNNMVPISMYTTVELCCFVHALFINRDKKMHCTETNTYAHCRSTNLCQEIGQVTHIFADKTGTITRNEMELKVVALADQKFGRASGSKMFTGIQSYDMLQKYREAINSRKFKKVHGSSHIVVENWSLQANYEFWTIIGCCHSALVSTDMVGNTSQKVQYDGADIDEITLLKGALKAGVRFVGKRQDIISLEYLFSEQCAQPTSEQRASHPMKFTRSHASNASKWTEKYEVLLVNAFTSKRRRMSVLVKRLSDNSFVLFVKGADEMISARACKDRASNKLRAICDQYAKSGLRVLMMAKRELKPSECREFLERYIKIQSSSIASGRDEILEALADTMEQNLSVVGVTGIEDKLQHQVAGSECEC